MQLPGGLLNDLGSEKQKRVTFFSLFVAALASISGILWGICVFDNAQSQQKAQEGNICSSADTQPQMAVKFDKVVSSPTGRRCPRCGRG